MKLIQLSTLDLEQKIESEIGENPALESGIEIVKNENSENDYDENTKIETDEIDIDQYLSDDEVPAYRLYTNNFSSDDEDRTSPGLRGGISFHQHLSPAGGKPHPFTMMNCKLPNSLLAVLTTVATSEEIPKISSSTIWHSLKTL